VLTRNDSLVFFLQLLQEDKIRYDPDTGLFTRWWESRRGWIEPVPFGKKSPNGYIYLHSM